MPDLSELPPPEGDKKKAAEIEAAKASAKEEALAAAQ